MPDHRLEITADGSHSVYSADFDALYHSKHGAIQESKHVFIDSGLKHIERSSLYILEMGFGTGLNALLTLMETQDFNCNIHYETVEAYPLDLGAVGKLNYIEELQRDDLREAFMEMHRCEWEKEIDFTDFTFIKRKSKLEETVFSSKFDLVYYDAFAPLTQGELWQPSIFQHIAQFLNPNAILVSYCAKGSFKRSLIKAGFTIEKIPGPPGKREMIRGTFRT